MTAALAAAEEGGAAQMARDVTSSRASQQGSSSRANYLINWEAIRSSRQRGMASYDIGGTDQQSLARAARRWMRRR